MTIVRSNGYSAAIGQDAAEPRRLRRAGRQNWRTAGGGGVGYASELVGVVAHASAVVVD